MGASVTKEFILHDVDISENWGRGVNVRGMSFMAAPLMWYGVGFYKVISKEEFLKFNYSILIADSSIQLVHIKLFELYDNPSKKNRPNKANFGSSLT
jgi:hypothetical protein